MRRWMLGCKIKCRSEIERLKSHQSSIPKCSDEMSLVVTLGPLQYHPHSWLLIGTSSFYLSVCNPHHRASLNCSTDLNFVVKYTTWPHHLEPLLLDDIYCALSFPLQCHKPRWLIVMAESRERRRHFRLPWQQLWEAAFATLLGGA